MQNLNQRMTVSHLLCLNNSFVHSTKFCLASLTKINNLSSVQVFYTTHLHIMSSETTTLKRQIDKYAKLLKARYKATNSNQLQKINKEIENVRNEIYENKNIYSVDELIKVIKRQNTRLNIAAIDFLKIKLIIIKIKIY